MGELNFTLQFSPVKRFPLYLIRSRRKPAKKPLRRKLIKCWFGTLKEKLCQSLATEASADSDV